MEKTDWKRIGWLTAATLVLGAIIGACAGLLTLLLYGVEYVMLEFIESEFIPGAFTVPAVRRIASVTLGLGVAGVIWYLLRTKTEKVPSVKKAVNGGRMPFWQTIVHVVLADIHRRLRRLHRARGRAARAGRHAGAAVLRHLPYR